MRKFNTADLARLAEARAEMREMAQFILDRARTYTHLHGGKQEFIDGNGFCNDINEFELYDTTKPNVTITVVDVQGGGINMGKPHIIPKEFIFAETPTEEETKWEMYLALKAEFEPTHGKTPIPADFHALTQRAQAVQNITAPPARRGRKVTDFVRRQQDVTGCEWENYGIFCDKDMVDGKHCAAHANLKCDVCGAPATYGCPMELQFVCGGPLCPDHHANDHHRKDTAR